MACFVVPGGEAIVTTIITKVIESKEKKNAEAQPSCSDAIKSDSKIPFSRKLKWLNNLLWGGSFLLAFEHVWHGEIAPWFPFLTAAASPESAAEMLREMSTVGVSMAAVVTAVWAVMVLVSNAIEKRSDSQPAIEDSAV